MQLNPMHLTVAKLLQGRLFRIPEYQRAYSWQPRQRDDLFKDIREAHRSQREHFMATVVALARDSRLIGADEYRIVELVDGQQRVTTLVILLKAIEKALGTEDKIDGKLKSDLAGLLVKNDDHNLVLLQTNHDSSDVFTDYVRNGSHKPDAVTTASDSNLLKAAIECETFVAEWAQEPGALVALLATIRNKLSMIYHELAEESTVYRVFEVLNSRGLDVKWVDKTKSQMMASIFEYVEQGSRADGLAELQTIWRDIYRILGLKDGLGDEALRFAGTWLRQPRPNRILNEEEASMEVLRAAGDKLKTIISSANRLKDVVRKVHDLSNDHRRTAVTRISHARFLAVAIMLRGFDKELEERLLGSWERVTFRIFGIGGADTRHKVGDYVRLAFDVGTGDMSSEQIHGQLATLGAGYDIDTALAKGWDTWNNWYWGWAEELRYLLFRYDEYLARVSGEEVNAMQWAKIWGADPSKSIEHVMPQSSDKNYVHDIGNLTMLPPKMNSSLKDKPPKEKAAKYINCGLRSTTVIGRGIEEGKKWGRDAVSKRSSEIRAFVRLEWEG